MKALVLQGGRMLKEMKAACRLIHDYRSGSIEPGSAITQEHDRLIRLLATDPDVEIDGRHVGTIIRSVARADTRWNQETMAAPCEFHDQRATGNTEEANAIRDRFLSRCPSAWYCGVLAGP